jgi:hypothetical protein
VSVLVKHSVKNLAFVPKETSPNMTQKGNLVLTLDVSFCKDKKNASVFLLQHKHTQTSDTCSLPSNFFFYSCADLLLL